MITTEEQDKLAKALAGLPMFPSDIIKVATVIEQTLNLEDFIDKVCKSPFEYDTQEDEAGRHGFDVDTSAIAGILKHGLKSKG